MDSVDFSLDAWLPFPGFLWLYGEDESTLLPTIRDVAGLALLGKIVGLARLGVSLPWLWVRKSCRLVAISPFACRLAFGVICGGLVLMIQRAVQRWKSSSRWLEWKG